MTYTQLCSMFNFEMPEYAKDYYEEFIKEYNCASPVLTAENAAFVGEAAGLPEDGILALKHCAAVINENKDAHLCASFLACLTVYKRVPWVNYIISEDLFTVEGLHPQQVGWVLVAVQLANTLINKKPPENLNRENLLSFLGYSQACYNKHGYWGILEWHWNMLGAGGCMFMFGILKFVPGEFTGDFPVITDGKRYVSLTGGSYFIDKHGALTAEEKKSVAKSVFSEDDEKYTGNVIHPDGTVEATPTVFEKSVWRDYLRKGTHTIEIHIPSNIEYTPEKIREAYKQAVEFYKGFYPQHNTKAIAGYSWIFAPQLKYVLPENSNILAVNKSMHILPTTGTFDWQCRFIREGSGLQKRMKQAAEQKIDFHYAVMYTPTDEIDTFGS